MVSVIIPVYNAEKTLADCVQSILDQSCRDIELILIDDGSVDRSGQICDALQTSCKAQDIPCQVIHRENGGVSSARNCGMDHANGEYFVCVDSDDVVKPCYLEDLLRTARTHPELGHIVSGFRSVALGHDYVYTTKETLTVLSRRDYMSLYNKILIQSPCLGLYRTEVVRRNRLRMREDLSLAEDLLFNLDYLDAVGDTMIGVINKANYLYQDNDPDTLNRKYRPDLLKIYETVHQALARSLERWEIQDTASWQSYYNLVFTDYQKVLRNSFHRLNPLSRREKLAFNNAILQQSSFQEAFLRTTVRLSPALRSAYQSGNYRRVLAAERVQRIKSRVAGCLRGNKMLRGE